MPFGSTRTNPVMITDWSVIPSSRSVMVTMPSSTLGRCSMLSGRSERDNASVARRPASSTRRDTSTDRVAATAEASAETAPADALTRPTTAIASSPTARETLVSTNANRRTIVPSHPHLRNHRLTSIELTWSTSRRLNFGLDRAVHNQIPLIPCDIKVTSLTTASAPSPYSMIQSGSTPARCLCRALGDRLLAC